MRKGVIVVSCLSVCVCVTHNLEDRIVITLETSINTEKITLYSVLKKLKFSRIDSKTDTKLKSLCTSACY